MRSLTERDEGKNVVDRNGVRVGVVRSCRGGRAYVDPDPDVDQTVRSRLGWRTAGDHPLDQDQVKAITESEIRLR